MNRKILTMFVFTLFTFIKADSNILVLKPYSDIDSAYLDDSDVNTIMTLFIEGLLQHHSGEIESSQNICSDNDCALDQLSKTNNDEIIYGKLQKLGSKIIFSASILNVDQSFSSKATAMSVEDMEQVCLRLSKSIALRQTLEESADVDNITEKDEQESARRKSLGRVGLSIGYLFPFEDLTYVDHNYNLGEDSEEVEVYSNLLKFNWNYYNEFKNNTALLVELGFAPPVIWYADLNFLKFQNKLDTSPFYGGGLGFYSVERNNDWSDDIGGEHDSGMCVNIQAGLILYRTYDINVMLRTKFIQIFNEDLDRGIMFDIGVQWKMQTRDRGYTRVVNRYPILDIILDRN